MRIFMLGWEFPPQVSGGLGVACFGLVKALNASGVDVMFVLPRPAKTNGTQNPDKLHRSSRLLQTRAVSAPSSSEVHQAVEQAAAHAAASAAAEQTAVPPAPQPHFGNASHGSDVTPAAYDYIQETTTVESEEPQHFQRVTFVPIDAFLTPYMTATQYHQMVVDDVAYIKTPHAETSGRWVQRAISAGTGPIVQPPNSPPPTAAELRAMPAPIPPAPKHDFIQEPAVRFQGPAQSAYAGDLFSETDRYARLALAVSKDEDFDAIHAHDWMTFPAAMAVAAQTAKPLVIQIHSTELDRAGTNANPRVMELERSGMLAASRIVAVSYKTKTQLIEKYAIDPKKIEVVYNATETPVSADPHTPAKKHKTVLFIGRLTQQKGPDYFLRAAQKVLTLDPDVRFVIAGKGDLLDDLKLLAEELDIRHRVTFTGFLKKDPLQKAFRAADVYVMPSLSEPFGIAPLEALAHDVPVIISKQSGVAEVLRHVLKVDFWDTEDLANKILALLRHQPLAQTLRQHGHEEVRQLTWDDSAHRIIELYEQLIYPSAATPS